ncbi:hypothetical protein [Nitrosovibrio sp. Nv17]|uniref:hypothetical protein n=1 Tax=Nitrosovibrio sp. Nv17 TaxID=1855339 RepID=UPI0009316001|nr:hypothetical protein [Nitrosovibrio sp. Nv17]
MGLPVPEELKDLIVSWFEAHDYEDIHLYLKEIEGEDPEDPNQEYDIRYEINLIAEKVSQASVFIWISREGYIGIGIEKVRNVEKRVGKRIYGRSKRAFIYGREPATGSSAGVLALLKVVSDGEVLLCYQHIPMLLFPKIGITKETAKYLVQHGYPSLRDFRIITKETDSNPNILRYEPWK